MKYTRAPCKVEAVENGNLALLEGKIIGKFLQLVILLLYLIMTNSIRNKMN